MLLRAIREGSPTHLAVAFDEEAKAKRSEIYAEYKATRGAPPEDLSPQFPLVRRVLEALRVPAVGMSGWEADDVIATLAHRARARDWEVVVVTGDKDLLQLVDGGGRCDDSMDEQWDGPAEGEATRGRPEHSSPSWSSCASSRTCPARRRRRRRGRARSPPISWRWRSWLPGRGKPAASACSRSPAPTSRCTTSCSA